MTIEGDKKMWYRIIGILCCYVILFGGMVIATVVHKTGRPKPLPPGVSIENGWRIERWNETDRKMMDGISSPTQDDTWCWKGRCGVLGPEEEH